MHAAPASFHAFLRHYLVALQSFTRIPLSEPVLQWTDFRPDMLRASAPHFPGVGLLVGMAACLVFAVVSLLLPDRGYSPLAAAAACAIATALLTGAFHEAGLARLADGLGGATTQPRGPDGSGAPGLGALGAVAILLAMGFKLALLALLASESAAGIMAALLGGHVVSRFWPLLVMHRLDHVGDPELARSRPLAEPLERRGLFVALGWCALPLVLMALADGFAFVLFAVAASALAWFTLERLLVRRLQGFTTDGLGATQQACEIAFYFGAAAGLGR